MVKIANEFFKWAKVLAKLCLILAVLDVVKGFFSFVSTGNYCDFSRPISAALFLFLVLKAMDILTDRLKDALMKKFH